MAGRIFRQAALDRLSSPEQLDRILRVTNPQSWMTLLAITLLIAVAAVWGYAGSVDTTAPGQGVIVRTGGVRAVVAPAGGIVVTVNVQVGDHIHQGEVVATIAQPELWNRIKAAEGELDELRKGRDRALGVSQQSTRLNVESFQRQRANQEDNIRALQEQQKLAQEQVKVSEQLLARGLVTRQQLLTAQQNVVSLQSQIAGAQAQIKQIDAQQFGAASQPDQISADYGTKIADAERNLTALRSQQRESSQIVSVYSGEIVELKILPGVPVSTGQPILNIHSDVNDLEAILYVNSLQAKDIKAGMEAQLSPSTVKREEFGYLRAKVVAVSDYPATQAALMRNFQNDQLVSNLARLGPVNEIRVQLQQDPKTPSGFQWSSARGPSIVISSGTICSAQIVTRRQAPVTLVFPYIKQKLGLD